MCIRDSDIDPIGKNPISALEYYRNRDGRLRTKPKAPHPISPLVQGWLDSVTYSKLDFEKLPLDSCIEWLQKSSAKQTGEGPGVNFCLLYTSQNATSLSTPINWTNVGAAQTGTGGTMIFNDPANTGSAAFYRILVSP